MSLESNHLIISLPLLFCTLTFISFPFAVVRHCIVRYFYISFHIFFLLWYFPVHGSVYFSRPSTSRILQVVRVHKHILVCILQLYFSFNIWSLRNSSLVSFIPFYTLNNSFLWYNNFVSCQGMQNLLSSSLLSKNIKIKIYRTIILLVVLYGCETWSLTLREECRLRVFENEVLRRIFGPKRADLTGEWRRLHNEELYALSSPNIIRVTQWRRLRRTGHVACMGERKCAHMI